MHSVGESGEQSYNYAQNFNFFHFAESSTKIEQIIQEHDTNYDKSMYRQRLCDKGTEIDTRRAGEGALCSLELC